MFHIDTTDTLEGIASVTNVVEFSFSAVDGTTIVSAEGKLTNAQTTIYTATAVTRIISLTLVNTHSAEVTVNVQKDPGNAGTLYRVIPKDLTLGIGYIMVFDGQRITVMDASGKTLYGYDAQAHKDTHDPNDGSDPLDTAAASEISAVVAAGAGVGHSFARDDHIHAINHGITDNHIVTVDGSPNANEWGIFTANGIDGKTHAEARALLDLEPGTDFVAKSGGTFTGKLGIGISPSYQSDILGVTNEYYAQRIFHTSNLTGCAAIIAQLINTAVTADGGYARAAGNFTAIDNPASDSNRELIGLYGLSKTNNDTYAHGAIIGGEFRAQHYGTGIAYSVTGVRSQPYNYEGTITNTYGFYTKPLMAAGTIGTWYGCYIDNSSLGTGTITNLWGVYVANADADNYMAGDLQIGINCDVVGELTAGTKTFKIDHPVDPENKILYHTAIEGPRTDLIYRGTVKLVKGKANVNLDADSTVHPMIAGTFEALTQNAQVTALQLVNSFSRVKCSAVTGNTFTIESEDAASTDTVNWVVMAERADPFIKATGTSDADGRLIPEHDKELPDLALLEPEERIITDDSLERIEDELVEMKGKGYYIHTEAWDKVNPTKKVTYVKPVVV